MHNAQPVPNAQPREEGSVLTEKDFAILLRHVDARLEEHLDLMPGELIRRGLVIPEAVTWQDRLKMGGVMMAGTFVGVAAATYVVKKLSKEKKVEAAKEPVIEKETTRLRAVGNRTSSVD